MRTGIWRPISIILPLLIVTVGCRNSGESTAKAQKEHPKKVEAPRPIIKDPSVTISEKDVDFTVTDWAISGDTLLVGVQYGGGCREHDWRMFFNGAFLKSLPPQAILQLQHLVKDGPDPCRSVVRQSLRFDLTSIRAQTSGKLVVKWSGNAERSATYEY